MTVPDLAASWSATGVTASKTTVRRRLQDAGLHGHLAVKKPLLKARHQRLCFEFAREHLNWNWVDWSGVPWTYKSGFTMFQSDGPTFECRWPGEQLQNDCIVQTVKFGGGRIMMWGAKSFRDTGFLTRVVGNLNGAGYINILSDRDVPSAHYLGYGDKFILQDDGVPCNRARVVNE